MPGPGRPSPVHGLKAHPASRQTIRIPAIHRNTPSYTANSIAATAAIGSRQPANAGWHRKPIADPLSRGLPRVAAERSSGSIKWTSSIVMPCPEATRPLPVTLRQASAEVRRPGCATPCRAPWRGTRPKGSKCRASGFRLRRTRQYRLAVPRPGGMQWHSLREILTFA